MGVSSTILKFGEMELSVDVDKDRRTDEEGRFTYTIGIGTGFTTFGKGSVNIETPPLSREEFLVVIGQMQQALKLKPEE